MNYIINPSWFYWVGVVDILKTLAFVVAVISAIIWVMMMFAHFIDDECSKKTLILMTLLVVVTTLMAIFIPSKETLLQMKIAELATYDNTKIAIDTIKSAANYILECLKQLK